MRDIKRVYGTTMNHNAETEMPMKRRDDKLSLWKCMTMPLMILTSLVIVLLLSTLVARTAFADQVTLVPDGVLGTGGWGGVTVGNLSDGAGGGGGGDGTFASITGVLDTFTVSMSNNAAYTGATINSVTTWVRASVVGGTGGGERITFGSTSPVVSTSGTNTLTDEPTRSNYQFALVGVTTDADVDNLEIAVNTTTLGGGETAQVFEVWVVVDYTPAVGANELNACDSCHNQPPVEEASRNGATGAVIGSHSVHGVYACTVCHPNNAVLNHRGGLGASGTEGKIDMLANIQGGTYSLGSAGFIQDNEDGTGLGTCSDVSCHGGAATTTPQWGSGTLNCDGCHGAPPATNAHAAHYTAKGWASPDLAGTNCTACHPDNTAGHSDVTDGIVIVNAGLTPSGASPAISCGNAPALGCHNGKATPNWNTSAIGCQQCHTAGGTDPADPVTGLHDEIPTVSGVRHHPVDSNFSDCTDCHTTTPSDNHWDGIFQNSAPVINFDGGMMTFADGTPPTCTSSCHVEAGTSGPWARLWHENSDQTNGTECAGCHGDWANGWVGGVTHRTDTGAGSTYAMHNSGTNYECVDCHALEAASGYTFTISVNDWGGSSNHGNGLITINNNGTTWGRSGGLSGCAACHPAYDGIDGAAGQNSFTQTGWNPETVSGDTVNAGCDTCHGGGGQYWPNGAAYPDRSGRHDIHMARLSAELGFALPGSDAQQKQMCDYCHNDAAGAGGGGHDDNVSPADVGAFNQIWDAGADAGSAYVADGCNSIACHNNKDTGTTTYGWFDAGTSACLMCHTEGGNGGAEIADPTSGLHDVTPTISGQRHGDAMGCINCHTSTPSADHIGGALSAPNFAGTVGYNGVPTPPTCANTCHADNSAWERKWHENSTATNGNECAGCHGTFATGFVTGMAVRHQTTTTGDADGQIESSHDGTDKCFTCHLYKDGDTTYYDISTDHRDGNMQLNNQTGFTDNGATVGCGSCHLDNDGTADEDHEFADTTARWTRQMIAGPSLGCTGCHSAAGSGAAGVGPDSPHVITTRGGSFNACEDCHPGGSTGSMHSAAGVLSIGNASLPPGVSYTNGVNGYSGFNGIVLGGDAANAAPTANEATWCWGCHEAQTPDVSEWDGSSATYDLGSVTTNDLNWLTTTWTSGQATRFAYKTGQLASPPGSQTDASTHGVDGGSVGVDAIGNIGCTHCHDVHDTQGPNGAPYVRGTWQSNPYPEDGAPRSGASQTINSGWWGNVPRGSTNNNYGGFQIDQNNTGITVQNATAGAGLCELCHGNGDGTFSTTEVDSLDNDGSASSDWVSGSNSHARVVKGGSGSGAFNLYDEDIRLGQAFAGGSGNGYMAGLPSMAYRQQTGGDDGYGFRGTDGRSFQYAPAITGASRPFGYNQYAWGATVNGTTIDAGYHQFSCSKCHNPHASRLPRLLITNCLDTKVNTWDNSYVLPASDSSDGGSLQPENRSVSMSNVTSAQNCHRLSDPAYPQANGDGWNNVSPW